MMPDTNGLDRHVTEPNGFTSYAASARILIVDRLTEYCF
jgi:hypothetical protein